MDSKYYKLIAGTTLIIIGIIIILLIGGTRETDGFAVFSIWVGALLLFSTTKFARVINEKTKFQIISGFLLIIAGAIIMLLTVGNLRNEVFTWFGDYAIGTGIWVLISRLTR